MEYLLALLVILAFISTFFCSFAEAALYAVPYAYVKHVAEEGSRSGKILLRFKEDMGKPIAAILILNTLANTFGASIVGAVAADVFGENGLIVFAVLFSMAILYLGEITPKIAGVAYSKQVAKLVAFPLSVLIVVFSPLIWLSKGIDRRLAPEEDEPSVSHEEVLSMAAIGREEGALDHFEGSVITNVIGLDKLLVRDVLTPRVVVFRLSEDTKIGELEADIFNWTYSRVPLYAENDPDHLNAYITQRDVFRELLRGHKEITLKQMARSLPTIPELMRVDELLLRMFEQKEHICAVVDEHGSLAGIITLEDIIEEIVGREIVDEYDTISDLRTFAKVLRMAKSRKKQ